MQVWPLDQKDLLEEGIATHSSILAWRIPWTEEPGGLQPMGSERGRHDWSDLAHTHGSTRWNIIQPWERESPATETVQMNLRTLCWAKWVGRRKANAVWSHVDVGLKIEKKTWIHRSRIEPWLPRPGNMREREWGMGKGYKVVILWEE